jgi:hypothetical protein
MIGQSITLVKLFCSGSITRLCKLYNYLLEKEKEASLRVDEPSINCKLIDWQRQAHLKLLATLLLTFIELKSLSSEANRRSFDTMNVALETAPYKFTSL